MTDLSGTVSVSLEAWVLLHEIAREAVREIKHSESRAHVKALLARVHQLERLDSRYQPPEILQAAE